MRYDMAELTIMDMLLAVLAILFVGIAFAIRRLRYRMESDMKKNVVPYMGMRHLIKHKAHEHPKKKKRR
jgi:hypothetical protein